MNKESQYIAQFLYKQDIRPTIPFRGKTRQIYEEIYKTLSSSVAYANRQFPRPISPDYRRPIRTPGDVTKPNNFHPDSIPAEVRQHIDRYSHQEIAYSFVLSLGAEFQRKVQLVFVLEKHAPDANFHRYVVLIASWFYFASHYAPRQCASDIRVYLYWTSLKKRLPHVNEIGVPLREIHVNTAFTTSCPRNSEIVIYRKEEWFKVLIHETFHNFGLDFSGMDASVANKCVLKAFDVRSKVNAFESYAEFWAETINVCYCAYFATAHLPNYSRSAEMTFDVFLSKCETYMNLERTHSIFQMVKMLDYMGLTYRDLISHTKVARIKRNAQYEEQANVLSYYVVKTVLMAHFPLFLSWCRENNHHLLHFRQTKDAQRAFGEWIVRHYKTPTLLKDIIEVEHIWNEVADKRRPHDLVQNTRMSLFELN